MPQQTVTLPTSRVPGDFDISKPKPAGPADNRADIIVTAEAAPSPYRLPLRNEPDANDIQLCPNGQRANTERLQGDILRAGRGLQGCHPAPSEEGDITFRTTRIRRPGRRGGNAGQGTPAVSGVLHF